MLRVIGAVCAVCFAGSAWAVTGERWEYHIKASMSGMAMPASTVVICKTAGWNQPPRQKGEEKCKTSQFQRHPRSIDKPDAPMLVISWSTTCPEGTGTGRMVFQDDEDHFTGSSTFKTAHGTMNSSMSGGKKDGSCELPAGSEMEALSVTTGGMTMTPPAAGARAPQGGAMRGAPPAGMTMEQMQAWAMQMQRNAQANADSTSSTCDPAIASMEIQPALFEGNGPCAGEKQEMCARAKSSEGAYMLMQKAAQPQMAGYESSLSNVVRLCGVSKESIASTACNGAVQQVDQDYISKHCPERMAELVQKQCAGREFTSMNAMPPMCRQYAADKLRAEQARPATR
jgi:hypothetical protein